MFRSTATDQDLHAAFRESVMAGLTAPKKKISSRWLYDDAGSELFSEITRLPEYYLTRTEIQILRDNQEGIANFCSDGETTIVEYGAGFGEKTELLLEAVRNPVAYLPIDISESSLEKVSSSVQASYSCLTIIPIAADFLGEVPLKKHLSASQNVISFFPGSTIGNLSYRELGLFFRNLEQTSKKGGKAIIGIDLRGEISAHKKAYDDSQGITAAFNLNLLRRINRELGGTFPIDRFQHSVHWNEDESAVEMHLRSTETQSVTVAGATISFSKGETIHTESSRKYSLEKFRDLARVYNWEIDEAWRDSESKFAVLGLMPRKFI